MRRGILGAKVLFEQSPPPEPIKGGGDLFLYLTVSTMAISVALIQEENRVQLLIYYVSQVFKGDKARYPHMENIVFTLIVASRKLRPYFQTNPILVIMDQPIKKAMNKPEAAGRLVQWVIKLSQFDVKYRPRTAIKAQALVGFITMFTLLDIEKAQDELESLTILTDGLSIQKR